MPLYKTTPPMSSRMGILRVLSTIKQSAILEFGCMGHNLYARAFLNKEGIVDGSKIFSTHIDETDIALGGMSRVKKVLDDIIQNCNPKAVFFLPSAVPLIVGTDLESFCTEYQPDYPNCKLIFFGKGGFIYNDFDGIEQGLFKIVTQFTEHTTSKLDNKYNLIGSCSDMFLYNEDSIEIQRILKESLGLEPHCILSSNCDISQIQTMSQAKINIVLRKEGIKSAEYLKETYGTPFLYVRPYGVRQTVEMVNQIAKQTDLEINNEFIDKEQKEFLLLQQNAVRMFLYYKRVFKDDAKIIVGGHNDIVSGLCDFLQNELSLDIDFAWSSQKQNSETYNFMNKDDAMERLANKQKNIIFADYEILSKIEMDTSLSLTASSRNWNINNYKSPFVGFRGAIRIMELILNTMQQKI